MKSFKTIALIMLIAIFLLTSFTFFGAAKKTVVLMMLGMESPYCPGYVSNFQKRITEGGYNFMMMDAKFDAQLQSQQMDQAIAMKPELILLFAADSKAIIPGLKKAYDKKIRVLTVNNVPAKEAEKYVMGYAGPNAYMEAQVAGQMIHELLKGKGKVVMIEGLAGQQAQIDRANGFLDKLKELNSGVELLARQPADWRKDKATQVMADFITRFGDEIDLVYGQDDTLTIGAAIALKEAGVTKDIYLIGIGGSKEGLKAIDDGQMYGTVLQSPVLETDFDAIVALKILKSNMKYSDKVKPFYNYMDTPKVTKDNVAKYLPGDW